MVSPQKSSFDMGYDAEKVKMVQQSVIFVGEKGTTLGI